MVLAYPCLPNLLFLLLSLATIPVVSFNKNNNYDIPSNVSSPSCFSSPIFPPTHCPWLGLDFLPPDFTNNIHGCLQSQTSLGRQELNSKGNKEMTAQVENIQTANIANTGGDDMEPNALGWHPGEVAAHKLLKVSTFARRNPTQPGLSFSHGYRVVESPIIALGTVDDEGDVWTTLWGGEKGFARPVAKNVLGLQSLVDVASDPFVGAVFRMQGRDDAGAGEGVVKPGGDGRIMSGLSLDLETRDRVKLAGRLLVASLDGKGGDGAKKVREIQAAMAVDEGLGNCPKYMNRKVIRAHVPNPEPVVIGKGSRLPDEALGLIGKADMMFLSSTNGRTMDTNHRGGPPGFIRVLSNDDNGEGGVALVYPEYSGNQLYQSLGNLQVNPRVGVVIPDYETSDVLYLTGETQLLVGSAAASVMPHSKVAVVIRVKEARFVKDGLPFRGTSLERSPYNPPVRRLAGEGPPGVGGGGEGSPAAIATLIKKDTLSPTIARFTFQLRSSEKGGRPSLPVWEPGQHVTLDFSGELDPGWSHMREDDPQSLNDDFVRTFTVSNPPPTLEVAASDGVVELEVTVRRHGPATGFLWAHKFQVPLELPVLGFGGEAGFRIPITPGNNKKAVFVAGGVGITPLLAQAPGLIEADVDFVLLWSLRAQDLGLAVDSFERIPGLAQRTRLFITGTTGTGDEDDKQLVEKVSASVSSRRLLREDLLDAKAGGNIGTKFYLCASVDLQRIVEGWLHGEEYVSESFNY